MVGTRGCCLEARWSTSCILRMDCGRRGRNLQCTSLGDNNAANPALRVYAGLLSILVFIIQNSMKRDANLAEHPVTPLMSFFLHLFEIF